MEPPVTRSWPGVASEHWNPARPMPTDIFWIIESFKPMLKSVQSNLLSEKSGNYIGLGRGGAEKLVGNIQIKSVEAHTCRTC